MTKYEKNMMANLTIMKISCIVLVLLNLLIPCYRGAKTGLSIFSIVICLFWIYGTLNGLGYFTQSVPIMQIGIMRIIQLLYYVLLKYEHFSWMSFLILLLFDIVYMMFLLLDKANYTYEKREVESDD